MNDNNFIFINEKYNALYLLNSNHLSHLPVIAKLALLFLLHFDIISYALKFFLLCFVVFLRFKQHLENKQIRLL